VRRRAVSGLASLTATAVLIGFDLCGLIAGVYCALALRELFHGATPIRWSTIWSTETDWLPFLALVTVLVFSRAGLYGPRERRAGFGSLLGSLTLVGVLTVAFAVGAGHEFSTYGAIPTAIVLTAAAIGVLRIAYDVGARAILRLAHVRRRALLLGDRGALELLGRCRRTGRGGSMSSLERSRLRSSWPTPSPGQISTRSSSTALSASRSCSTSWPRRTARPYEL
jgi:hypothetical protein